jgi:hypothetical protein
VAADSSDEEDSIVLSDPSDWSDLAAEFDLSGASWSASGSQQDSEGEEDRMEAGRLHSSSSGGEEESS